MTIAAGLSATKAGFDLIKNLREALGRAEVNPGDIQARLVEIGSLMLDTQKALADAEEENRNLKRKLEEATRQLDIGASFIPQHGVYWRDNYPYCPNCWDSKRLPTRLSGPLYGFPSGPNQLLWTCPIHKGDFHLPKDGIK